MLTISLDYPFLIAPFGILKRLFKEFFFSNTTKHNWVRLSTHNVKATQMIAEIIIALYITKPYN
jgi:hypothetical protein